MSSGPFGEVYTKFRASVPDAFVGYDDAPLGAYQLDIAQAEVEDMIEPDGVADELCWKAVTRKHDRMRGHQVSFA
jgi:hypothetical protein